MEPGSATKKMDEAIKQAAARLADLKTLRTKVSKIEKIGDRRGWRDDEADHARYLETQARELGIRFLW